MYCDLYFHSGKQISIHAGDALSLAITSAINGREASVYDGDELVWFVEVDTKVDDDSPHHPAIVHFRGASLADAAADLMRRDQDVDIAALNRRAADDATRFVTSDKPDKSRARSDSEPSSAEQKRLEQRTGATGLEPATSGVTGRRSNQLNYAPVVAEV